MKSRVFNKFKMTGLVFLLIPVFSNSQIKDYDGNVYKTTSYGVQEWTTSNLNVSHFRNGDPIPMAASEEEWKAASENGQPVFCYYENDPENGKKYGKLYNWYAINDARGLAPEGWHIPGNADWRTLVKNLLGVDMAGSSLKSTVDWKSGTGTNKIGFTAVPSGYRDATGKFRDIGKSCRMWSNSAPVEVKPTNLIYSIALENTSVEVRYLKSEKGSGFSVRCEKD